MPKAEFPYVPFHIAASEAQPNGSIAYRPLAAATITASNGNSIRFIVMPDSGADACVFPLSLAILLKLDVLNLPKAYTGGVGSQNNPTYYDAVTIDMGEGIVFKARAGFAAAMDTIGFGLLRQDGFFSQHNVEFRHAEKLFTVETL